MGISITEDTLEWNLNAISNTFEGNGELSQKGMAVILNFQKLSFFIPKEIWSISWDAEVWSVGFRNREF